MAFVSRGFHGRRREEADTARVPPGQYVTADFPVLSAGPTPHTTLAAWDFAIVGEVDDERRWTWEEFQALPS
jgi:DMSO/TMAO reductase YedYZ molybdopterin-dependent catalytic subunit